MAKSNRAEASQRWVHVTPGDSLDAELGELFRTALDEAPLSPAALSRVGRRLTRGDERRRRPLFRLLPLVLALLTGGTGAAFAQWASPDGLQLWSYFARRAKPTPTPTPTPTRAAVVSAPAGVTKPVSPVSVGPASATPLAPAPSQVASEPAPKLSPVATPSASPLALESELLQRALEKLRREHDGASALRSLDEYSARFPRGALQLEASLARVDALLLLGRRTEVRALLSQLPLERLARRTELRLLRAELYAEKDCGKALVDFEAVLTSAGSTALGERALYGRATCRLRSGDAAGGQADLQSYVARYPSGRFASQVRTRLERAPFTLPPGQQKGH